MKKKSRTSTPIGGKNTAPPPKKTDEGNKCMVVKSVFFVATDKISIFSENWQNALVEEYKNT